RADMHEGRKRGILAELFFNFYEQGNALTHDLHHSSEFFSPARAQALVRELLACIEDLAGVQAATHAPDPRLLAINRATAVPFDVRSRVEAWVSRQASATPEATAVVVSGEAMSYRTLVERAKR